MVFGTTLSPEQDIDQILVPMDELDLDKLNYLAGMLARAMGQPTYSVVPFVNKRALGSIAGIVGAGGNMGAVAAGFLLRVEDLDAHNSSRENEDSTNSRTDRLSPVAITKSSGWVCCSMSHMAST